MTKLISAAAILIVIAVAVAIGSSWAPDLPLAQLKARWAEAPSEFIQIDGMQVHIRDQGQQTDANPIVLIHGTSASLHTWDAWTNDLSADRRVLRFDLPAFGLTGPAPDNDYSAERYAAFVLKVMDARGIERAVLAGNSLGGQIAMETALLAPSRVAALVLVDSAGYPFRAESMPLGFRLAQIPAMAPLMDRLLPRSMIESSVRDVYGDPSLVTDELVERYYQLTLREGNRRALAQRFSQMTFREDARQRAATLAMPTLLIWGDEDRLIPPSIGELMDQDIPDSTLVMLEGVGHVPHEEAPGQTLSAVREFLASREL
ncbi:alpha/beta fold hydrolase [Alcanivorax sp. 1008]|uniref:alpha/beta fold hydrolase n=1 Tax=Alcanivorax sp. 1008 TaxID=2816853 RepID=UPI001D9F7759|nr:alpha/beta fold hydrolase [Alcanivorax sp. 1008]MCC1497763.1 alpha/beta fold hydrolase [Alcanivorax sp. 1008]